MQTNGVYSRGGTKLNGYDRRPKGVTNIKTKIDQREPGFDFIDLIESQFGAILYS